MLSFEVEGRGLGVRRHNCLGRVECKARKRKFSEKRPKKLN
jgi:hypothetical protein